MSITLSGNLLTLREVIQQTKMSKSSIYRAIKNNGFPKPIINGGKSLWHTEHIEEYLQKLITKA